MSAPVMTHSCDDPIRCSTCLAVKSARATKRRTAARKAAATRNRRKVKRAEVCPVCGGTTRNPDNDDFKCPALCEYGDWRAGSRCSDSAPGQDVAS